MLPRLLPTFDTPQYRLFLIAAPGDRHLVPRSVLRTSESSFQNQEIFLFAPPSVLSGITLPSTYTPISGHGSTYNELFTEVLRRFGDRDSAILSVRVVSPEKWDLRLAWSAMRQPGTATVSPLDMRLLAGARRGMADHELLDRLCYHHSHTAMPEVRRFLPECVYVRADAVQSVLATGSNLDPESLRQSATTLRYSHVVATHICVSWEGENTEIEPEIDSALLPAVMRMRARIYADLLHEDGGPPSITTAMGSRNLHITHSWGGGLERWVNDYCHADRDHDNLVLKSVGSWGAFGSELHLYRRIDEPMPLKKWQLSPPIKSTTPYDVGYRAVLAEILNEYGIGRIFISSLIGHSLEALRSRIPTLMVCHDFYPFCPALNITFETVCDSCDELRLAECTLRNPHHRFFRNVPPAAWLELRREFAQTITEFAIPLAVPTPSVGDYYLKLMPELAGRFYVIPHGTPRLEGTPLRLRYDASRRLRVLIIGSLAPHKGGFLLERMMPSLREFSDVSLVGCGEYGEIYRGQPGITILTHYDRAMLPALVSEMHPDVALLLSVVPETFSYTLQELFDMALPVVATRIGSFQDRIQHGRNGFLCDPAPDSILACLRGLNGAREELERIHEGLKTTPRRSMGDMLSDYEAASGAGYCANSYFGANRAPAPLRERRLQLFWRTATGGYCEEESTVEEPLGVERQTASLTIPVPPVPITELRLDLSAEPGFLLLHGLRLADCQGRILWQHAGNAKLLDAGRHSQVEPLQLSSSQNGILLYCTGDDPFVILPVSAGILSQLEMGGSLDVEFTLGSASDYAAELVSLVRLSAGRNGVNERETEVGRLARSLAMAQTDVATKGQQMEQLARETEELKGRVAAMETSFSWRSTRPLRAIADLVMKVKSSKVSRRLDTCAPEARSNSAGN